jgi:hypothetical protein
MIIKGSSRGGSQSDAVLLAQHLLAAENERVAILELRGVGATDLSGAIEEMRALSLATRSRRPLYHASISVTPEESHRIPLRQWMAAADELERRLGLAGHQRAVVQHAKHGRKHIHIVWSRIDPATLRVTHDGQTYRKHEQCARALEQRWRLKPVIGAHTRPEGIDRPVAAATHKDWQAQARTGIAVKDVAAILRRCWRSSLDGESFMAAIKAEGLCLARGRRGIVVVDRAGTPHSIPRRLGIKAVEVRRRLRDLDPAALPTVEAAKHPPPTRRVSMPRKTFTASQPRRRRPGQNEDAQAPTPLAPGYWHALGYEAAPVGPIVVVTLSGGTRLEDHGDRLVLDRDGEPTDEEIRLMVAAGKAKGWGGIRFSGGSESFQRRARIEALRQGYELSQIALECEDGKPRPAAFDMPMPDHVRRRLAPPPAPDETPSPQPISTKAPAYGLRP